MKDSDIKNAFATWRSPVVEVAPAPVVAKTEPAPVTARLNYEAVGVCPYCKAPMQKTLCCGQEVYLCMDDRAVTPLPNSELL